MLLPSRLLSSKPSCLMNDHCSGATSKCVATCARSACAPNFTRQLSQLASAPSKFEIPMALLVYNRHVTGAPSRFLSNHWITSSQGNETNCILSTLREFHSVVSQQTSTLSRLRYHDSKCAVVMGIKRNVDLGTRMA